MRNLIKNRAIATLLCLTLLFKVVIPVGFMPDMDALQHGVYKITICSGYHHAEMLVDDHQKPVNDSGKNETSHKTSKTITTLCPFAGINSSALPVAILALALLLFWRELLFRPKTDVIRSVSLASAWPRGPPLRLA